MNRVNTGIVVPTLGTRHKYLLETLASIRNAGNCHILIVAPDPDLIHHSVNQSYFDDVIKDPGLGLPEAINAGVRALPSDIQYVNWLGDDDLLEPKSLSQTSKILDEFPQSVFVYGKCDYIGPNGEFLLTNHSGNYAKLLMRFGPQLIPQPGSLIRRSTFEQVGGLNAKYKWAFDLDLLFKLSKVGKLTYLRQLLASFRWHDESLSVGGREGSVREASEIRVNSLPAPIRIFSSLWEIPMKKFLLGAGTALSNRSKKSRLEK